MSDCKVGQVSDQMTCECGNVWDMNDPVPPNCRQPFRMKLKALESALEMSFQDYMWWCHEYVSQRAEDDQMMATLLDVGGAQDLERLDTLWAKRYYFHHAGKVKP